MLFCPDCALVFSNHADACPQGHSALAPLPLLETLDIVADIYRVNEVIGHGPLATVYSADHIFLSKPCALKVLHQPLAGNRTAREMLIDEARRGGQADGPFIAEIFDAGSYSEGRPFLVSELLDGFSLQQIRRESGGSVPPERAGNLVRLILTALASLHRQGITHGNLKPSNVLFDRDGHVKLTGIAFGRINAYSPPEPPTERTPRSDLYSVGLILHELLTGTLPDEDVSPHPAASRLLATDPEARPESATAAQLSLGL